jgi:protein SCO1/2
MAMATAFTAASAHAPLPPPDLNERAGFDQRLGAQVPLALRFRDATGESISLGQVAGGRPILLALGYYRCPNLCGLVMSAMAQSIGTMTALRAGADYEVAFVSIDPLETPVDAIASQRLTESMNPTGHVADWHFLSGDAASIEALAQALGYRYFQDQRNDQFAHGAGLVVLTGEGRVAQYLFGVRFPERSLRLALVGASAGRLGNVVDQLVLLCSGYDPTTGRYSVLIGGVMQIIGVAFALLLSLALLLLHRRRRGEGS